MRELTLVLFLVGLIPGFEIFSGAATSAFLGEKRPDAVAPAIPYRVPAALADAFEPAIPEAVHLHGWLGHRVDLNAKNRMRTIDTEPLLVGFRQKPGSHPWIGEHIGKWMHAATLAWANANDSALRAKLDRAATELISAQEPDGYLGTYVPEKRFGLYREADWDVWSHKYNLLGLLTYYQFTGNEAALQAGRRMGDLLVKTFPTKKSILAAGTHVGMASTSVLEPMVLLYRFTGDAKYLEFCRYLVQSWNEPNGPKIIASLLQEKSVLKTANAKAYEMLSNLVGLCELARVTGDRSLLTAVLIAWEDVVANRLYLTGSASSSEHFQADHHLPNGMNAHVGETCVTATWIQLNWQLLRLTGDTRYGQELERTFYNHLTAAQSLNGSDWCYFTALEGQKKYDSGITCCHSSGPRGMVLAPLVAYGKMRQGDSDVLAVNTLEDSVATLELGGQPVTIEQDSQFPIRGRSILRLRLAQPGRFGIRVRVPYWAGELKVKGARSLVRSRAGWAEIPPQRWKPGATLQLQFDLSARLIPGTHGNADRAAMSWGPFILAYDQAKNPGLPAPASMGFVQPDQSAKLLVDNPLTLRSSLTSRTPGQTYWASLIPFADAGMQQSLYRIWLRAPGAAISTKGSVLSDGIENRSRSGNVQGSIIDDDAASFVVTFDNRPSREDWFAVTSPVPVTIRRVVFIHGQNFHDGGWFDTRSGKPTVQVQRTEAGPWETIGELADYPSATDTQHGKLEPGQSFVLRLSNPVIVRAMRVIGVPACGDNASQSFSSCAELQAFPD